VVEREEADKDTRVTKKKKKGVRDGDTKEIVPQ
jgi:hypothetical protein